MRGGEARTGPGRGGLQRQRAGALLWPNFKAAAGPDRYRGRGAGSGLPGHHFQDGRRGVGLDPGAGGGGAEAAAGALRGQSRPPHLHQFPDGAAPGEKILPGGGREPEAPGDGRHQAGLERAGL